MNKLERALLRDLAPTLRPHVEALYFAGIKTGEAYEALAGEIISDVYAVPDGAE